MKRLSIIFWVCCLLVMTTSLFSQVTNLTVNGSSTSFSMVSGGAISWQYNVPVGATAWGVIFYDVDQDHLIDTSIDVLRFYFTQTDGQGGDDGPPDTDGLANGVITFSTAVGLAPGDYVLYFAEGEVGLFVAGTVTPLPSPAHTISGRIIPPLGESAANIFVEIRPGGDNDDRNWEAITDSQGDYEIQMDADTSGNPWRLRLASENNPFPPLIVSPEEYSITIIGNYSGYDFTFVGASAKVTGFLRDEDGNPIANGNVYLYRINSGGNNRDVDTDENGYYEIWLSSSELSNDEFHVGAGFDDNDSNPPYLRAEQRIYGIHEDDSLSVNITVYRVNSSIQGMVQINGNPPGFPIQIFANVGDTAFVAAWADSNSGNFSLPASNKLYNYHFWANNLPGEYMIPNLTAHPGQTGVIFNITVNGVSEREPGVPSSFSLSQNYPNPFNPTTTIDYDLARATYVRLSLFNVLGEEVLNVVNQEQAAGKYRATVDAASLPGGVYLYRLTAGTLTQTKKLLLLK